jgi:hypothetical protein
VCNNFVSFNGGGFVRGEAGREVIVYQEQIEVYDRLLIRSKDG